MYFSGVLKTGNLPSAINSWALSMGALKISNTIMLNTNLLNFIYLIVLRFYITEQLGYFKFCTVFSKGNVNIAIFGVNIMHN